MKVIITGSQSFIGREVIRQCGEREIEVFGIDALAPESPSYTFIQSDIRDKDLASKLPKDADAVIHLAALSRDQDCKGKMLECFDINVMGTLNVLRAAKGAGAKQFIFASSEWVYESFAPGEEKDEEAPIDITKHTSEYALSKLVSEANLRIEYSREAYPTTILRFGIIYGPRKNNWAAVESLASKVKKGEPVEVGSLKTGRRFVHVSDIAAGILAAIGQKDFSIFNLTGDKLETLGDVIRASEEVFDKKATVRETAPENISIRNPANNKAKTVLGWQPKITLKEGIASLESYL